jgi:hypothetical protein
VSDELPAVAEARMAEIRASGTWGSALTSDEFAAIRSVGFAPAGQVLGACVYNIGYTGGYACPGSWGTWGYGNVTPYQTKTQVSSRAGYGSFAPLVQAMYEARHKALDRMTAECEELGGHGVVGVRLTIGAFPAGGRLSAPPASGRCPAGRIAARTRSGRSPPTCPGRTSPS